MPDAVICRLPRPAFPMGYPSHLDVHSGGDWIICSACPLTTAGKALISVGFLPPKCVDKRGLFRCPQTFHDSPFVEEAQDNDRDHRSQK